MGDYAAGPNHTLPTGGTARYASPLSVDEFVKKSSVIQYSSQALARDADMVTTIARHEGLWAHAMSVEMRKNLLDSLSYNFVNIHCFLPCTILIEYLQ